MAKSRTDVESVVKLVINGEQAKTSMKEITDSIRKYEAEIKNMRQIDNPKAYKEKADAIGVMKNALNSARKEMSGLNDESKKVTTETKTLGSTWKDVAKGIIAGGFIQQAVGVIKNFGTTVVETYTKFEKFNAILENALGSSQAARLAFSDIREFAKATPFQLDELTESYVKLVNRGLQPSMEQMRKMGDLAASQGKSFDQLTEAIMDAGTGEFERLKEFGIRASKNGDMVALSFKGVTTEVKFTEDAINNAVLAFGDMEGVADSMAKTSATLGGKISNLGDTWDQLLTTIGSNTGGAIYSAVTQISEYLEWLNEAIMSTDQRIEMSIDQRVNRDLVELKGRNETEQQQIIGGIKLFIKEYTDELNTMPDTIKGSKASQYFRTWFGMDDPENIEKTKLKQDLEVQKRTVQGFEDYQKQQVEIKKKAEDEKMRIAEKADRDDAARAQKAAAAKAKQLAAQLEKEKEKLKELAKGMQQDFDISSLDGLDKTLAEIDKKYNPLIEKAKRFKDAASLEIFNSLKNSAITDAKDSSIKKDAEDDEKNRKEAFTTSKSALEEDFAKKGLQNSRDFENEDLTEEEYNALQYETENERLLSLALLYESYGESSIEFEQQLSDRKIAIKQKELEQQRQLSEGERAIQMATVDNFAAGIGLLKGLVNKRGAAFKALLVAEKAATIAQIIMNTQAEIAGYYRTYASIPGGPAIASGLAVAAKVRSGIGIATVVAAGAKELFSKDSDKSEGTHAAKGGFVPTGPSHASGGIKMIDGVTGAFLGEMEGGEPIISRDTYKNNPELVDALLYAGQRKNGAAVNIDMNRMQQAERMYRTGGISPVVKPSGTIGSSGGTTTPTILPLPLDLTPMLDRMDKFIDAANDAWNLRNFKEKEARYNQVREDAGA